MFLFSSTGFSILRCKLACTFPTSKGRSKDFTNITHYHCYGCAAGFKREKELLRHLKSSHSLNLPQQKQQEQQVGQQQAQPIQQQQQPQPIQQQQQPQPIQQQQQPQPIQQQQQPQNIQQQQQPQHIQQQQQLQHIQQQQQMQQKQQQQESQQEQQQQQQQQLAVPQQKQQLETPEYVFVDESADYKIQSFDFKSPESRSLRQQPPKVKCPYNECGRDLHPNSLSSHIRTQHQSTNLKINQSRYLNGVCVDQRNGI